MLWTLSVPDRWRDCNISWKASGLIEDAEFSKRGKKPSIHLGWVLVVAVTPIAAALVVAVAVLIAQV
jgi:hypothetical protein